MEGWSAHREKISQNGFTILEDVYKPEEIAAIIDAIKAADQSNLTFRKTDDLFAIRQFLKEVPEVKQLIFNEKLKALIGHLFNDEYFIVKAIYFDKPEKSNWFVAWHQDLTISVDKKGDLPGYGPWTTKLNQFAVQPPVDILLDNFTIRIHLDDTDEGNGALKVIKGSHLNIARPENLNKDTIIDTSCNVPAGGVMIMLPLLMHASNRTTSNKKRRVIHIEFSRQELPVEINWAERESY
ncbi:phytanoyl-CoA dioxygenase family protein [Mucilaginibacter sp. BJC16-A38]|uniref:phytanoyl-CoA dioxygenase family protein n=1 Tax=Mucilaginibacter phenanthrenivorans TaxID=1234842 RepID=UPI0021583B9D|nr:phytanoyl-CoA dioxygenase family protein [Mucilaginibacter phenanthrenivorans]MCR8557101.1 phytanoyl-CoA dioxygenase family protein [Mucilaginibacter phenanthrenivorans]